MLRRHQFYVRQTYGSDNQSALHAQSAVNEEMRPSMTEFPRYDIARDIGTIANSLTPLFTLQARIAALKTLF